METMQNDIDEYRAFGGIDEGIDDALPAHPELTSRSKLLKQIENSIVGENRVFMGPFGERSCVYADWTASGRALAHIEGYILNEVLPLYGNTHTTTSRTGHQSTCFRHESRQILAQAVNAKITGKAATDIVLFTGNGTTAAINKLVHALGLHLPLPASMEDSVANRPVVFTSSYEHHSNLLPWREAEVDVVTIRLHPRTGVCLTHLAEQLLAHADRKLKIGAFAAASNVTGLLTDVDAVSIAMHRAGGVVVFDYAAAAPYVKIDMNPVVMGEDAPYVYKDAIVFSGHKFIGGPGAPGVLIAKKRLIPSSSEEPTSPGGGTVFFVTDDHHRYLSNREEREEGGTPNVLGDVKLGLVVHFKQLIGATWIEQEEVATAKLVHSRLVAHPAIHLLGHLPAETDSYSEGRFLPIISFLIQPVGTSRFLHYNFVCALLNDLFGIQSRGGCMCAGPYSQWLLGLSDYSATSASSLAIENALLDKQEVLRPGYTRLSLPYFTSPEKRDFILTCIEFVADYGALFLPQYRYNPRTGEWAHTTRLTKFPERVWLSNFNPLTSQAVSPASISSSVDNFAESLELAHREVTRLLAENKKKLDRLAKNYAVSSATGEGSELNAYEGIRWLLLASDFPGSIPVVAQKIVQEHMSIGVKDIQGPIRPNAFMQSIASPTSPVPPSRVVDNALLTSHQPSLYAQKRDKKMSSRAAGDMATREPTLPRYADPSSFVGGIKDKNSIGELTSSNAVSATAACKSTVTTSVSGSTAAPASLGDGGGDCVASTRPLPVTLVQHSNADKVLSGVGVVYQGSDTVPSMITSGGVDGNNDKASKVKAVVPPKKILKTVGQAIADWNMIEEGDRLLLGLSGGKDSLAMLHILLHLQRKAPVNFTIACATVDPQTESFDPSPLIPYVQSLGVTYHYLSEPIVALAKSKLQGDSLCAFCARFKRGLLYSCCRNNGYNKLVLAQHLDDLAESFFMSSLHNGQIRTMKANYRIDAEDLSVIRPLAYTREAHTRDFSLRSRFPVINENCPACFEEPKERARVKRLLSQEEAMIPTLFSNMRKALVPLMASSTYVAMDGVCKEVEARARRSHDDGRRGGSQRRACNGLDSQDACVSATAEELRREGIDAEEECSVGGVAKRDLDSVSREEEVGNILKKIRAEEQCSDGYCVPCYELA